VLTTLALAGGLLLAPATFPPNTGPVVDAATVVPPSVERRVEEALVDFAERTGATVAVAVVASTEPLDADEYARELARDWGTITTPFDRAILMVLDVTRERAGLAVSLSVAPSFDRSAQEAFVARFVAPHLAVGDAADALEIGALELRRALGDEQLPAPVGVVAPVDDTSDDDGERAWPAALFALAVAVALIGSRVVARRRRTWAMRAPVRWGTGWGRSVADPLAMWHRRHRQIRDAVHEAEAETGLPLCFWLGPTSEDVTGLADELFSRAAVEGHAAALLLVATDRNAVELRIADWVGPRLDPTLLDATALLTRVDLLVAVAERIAATGAPVAATGGGVAPPDLY
jgi:uncharacterized membrane protein YgcG